MKIGLAVAAYHPGNPAEYLAKSFRKLWGHTVDIIDRFGLETSFRASAHDVYICVDSGAPLDLMNACFYVNPNLMKRLAFWFIDYRHNKDRPPHERNPNDRNNARLVHNMGGWVFQAQFEDFLDCLDDRLYRSSYLPLAADPEVWSDQTQTPKFYDVSFIGHTWDGERAGILQDIFTSGLKFAYDIGSKYWKEAAAALMGQAHIGFNVSSFFGTPLAFDVNMRVFETLSCGLPLITNNVGGLHRLMGDVPFMRTYMSREQVVPLIQKMLRDEEFLQSGAEARRWVLDNATYDLRAMQMFETMVTKGVWPA